MVRPSPSLPPRWRWLALRAGRSINRAALPFLRDADLNDDDYELQPPKPKLEMLQLMGIAFFAVSGSAYGVEEIVPLGGPFLSLAALVIAPAVWSAPMLLVRAELSVALPRAGRCAAASLGGCEETHWSHRGRVRFRYVVWASKRRSERCRRCSTRWQTSLAPSSTAHCTPLLLTPSWYGQHLVTA